MANPNAVIVPCVVLADTYFFLNEDFVKGDILEMPNDAWASIRSTQERDLSPVLESSLDPKDSYYDGIKRTSTGPAAPPVYASSLVGNANPDVIDIAFDVDVSMVGDEGWTVKVDAGVVPVAYTSTNGSTAFLHLVTPIVNGESVTVEYDGQGKTVNAETGDFMALLAEQATTNNVT